MQKRYQVQLSEEETARLRALTSKGTAPARTIRRAQILLLAQGGEADARIAHAVGVGRSTVERTRKRLAVEGLEAALCEKPRPGAARKLDGKQEAFLVALACSPPPDGRNRWTMHLLAGRLVALDVVDTLSDETVRRTVKKGT